MCSGGNEMIRRRHIHWIEAVEAKERPKYNIPMPRIAYFTIMLLVLSLVSLALGPFKWWQYLIIIGIIWILEFIKYMTKR
jgi:hypothetical protein